MFRTNLITTTQTLNPVPVSKGLAFSTLSNEKGFLSVEPRDYFTHTPYLMTAAYFMAMVTP
ncbi:hypothetical protein OUS_1415 [Helicobacter pylori R056a]|uniref:Uncharacterized protein n=1 Tax=Helicobacter pylori R018c TaxID=1145110 RepID=K2KA20_HELPX|nr:hypothetical protein OUC_1314 [Helicobacter pylori R018c]EKE93902.1 hypothetical protein OUS_1415 [Helicobacter pylori R056a]